MSSDQRLSTRTPTSYDPASDLAANWPDWQIEFAPIAGGTERFDPRVKTVWIDPDAFAEDPLHALAHVAAHLRYDLEELSGRMTLLQEDNANSVAWLRLDREWAL